MKKFTYLFFSLLHPVLRVYLNNNNERVLLEQTVFTNEDTALIRNLKGNSDSKKIISEFPEKNYTNGVYICLVKFRFKVNLLRNC